MKLPMFAARGPLLAPEGDGSGGGGLAEQFAAFLEFQKQQKAAGGGSGSGTPAAAASSAPNAQPNIEHVIAQTVAATLAATHAQAQKPPTAAPSSTAGNTVNPITAGGMLDFWRMSAAELDQLGGARLREEFDKQIEAGRRLSGAPRVPMMPRMEKKR